MRRYTVLLCTIALAGSLAVAQKHKSPPEGSAQEEAMERATKLTGPPQITGLTPTTATINWDTNKNEANDLHYSDDGAHWKVKYAPGGSTHHSMQLTGLQPGKTYTYRIMTREKEVRHEGKFETPRK